MNNEFAVVNFLDECRWDSENLNNYNLINYAHSDLSNDEKILTHWISYITDRQMKFEDVWDIGGFVFSDMVRHYSLDGVGVANISSPDSFFTGSAFRARLRCPVSNEILARREFGVGSVVEFTSRFYPSDYVSIIYTLKTLESFDRSIVGYLTEIIRLYNVQPIASRAIIQGLAYGLYLLSYEDIGQHKADSLPDTDWIALANARANSTETLLSDKSRFLRNVDDFFKDSKYGKRYNCKRVWCSLRDYLKSPEFSPLFRESLQERNVSDDLIQKVFCNEAKQTVELPGDVWNNKSVFRNCLFSISGAKDKDGEPFNRQLRKLFEQERITVGYPEQFDVTFDFVQRMCDKQLCTICPFKAVYEENRISKICINNADMLCPVSLVTCGYVTNCKSSDCSLKKMLEKRPSY